MQTTKELFNIVTVYYIYYKNKIIFVVQSAV